MDDNGEHHVARIDDTVTSRNLHQRAEAVAVPDFDFLEQAIQGIAAGWVLTGRSGTLIAESPPVYRDADVCRRAFADAQHAARTALGRPSEQEWKAW
jgi:hypothetical protein